MYKDIRYKSIYTNLETYLRQRDLVLEEALEDDVLVLAEARDADTIGSTQLHHTQIQLLSTRVILDIRHMIPAP